MQALREVWETNNRINLLLLDGISKEGMASTLSTRGGRDVARQFAHLHTQRLRWLEDKGGKDLAAGLPRFESKQQPTRRQLKDALKASGRALSLFLDDLQSGERPVRKQKKGPAISVAYFVAHESHHRGSILLTLKQCGHAVDKATRDGI